MNRVCPIWTFRDRYLERIWMRITYTWTTLSTNKTPTHTHKDILGYIYIYVFILQGHSMLKSDWLMNILTCAIIFREARGWSWPHHMSISLRHMISVISTAKEPKPTATLTKQIHIVNNRITTTNYFHVFGTKLHFKSNRYVHVHSLL